MTDPHLDELASAHLDGTTTAEEAARIDLDPALRARVEVLRQVRHAVAAVPSPAGAARREAALDAALAAFDAAEDPAPPNLVAPSGAPSHSGTSPGVRRFLGAAAAVVLLALLVPLLGRLGGSEDDAAFSSSSTSIEPPTEALDSVAPGGDERSATASELDRDLGAFDDLDALVRAMAATEGRGLVERSPTITPERSTVVDEAACSPATAEAAGGADVERATATVGGVVVVVVFREGDDRGRRLVVYRLADCQVLADVQL